jgi:hypothetical protein
MKQPFSFMVIAGVLLLTGCSAGEDASVPADDIPEQSSGSITCDQPIVAILDQTSGKQEFTAVSRVSDGSGEQVTVLNDPFTAYIDWDVPRDDWVQNTQVQESISNATESPVSGEAGTLLEVSKFLKDINEPETHIGYAAVAPISIDIVVTCSNIPRALGTLHTWKLADVGAVTCDESTLPSVGAELAQQARKLYCD